MVELRERQNFTAAAWDTIRSNAEAENLRNDARLEPTLLTPAELGGLADAANVVLVPPTARAERDRLIAEVLDLGRRWREPPVRHPGLSRRQSDPMRIGHYCLERRRHARLRASDRNLVVGAPLAA